MDMHSPTTPPDIPKWLKFLYLFYKYIDLSPLTPRMMLETPQIRIDIDDIPIRGDWNLRNYVNTLHKWHYLYRFGEVKWQGYTYLINLRGLYMLRKRGLITEEEESYARQTVLSILERVDPKKYHKTVINMKR